MDGILVNQSTIPNRHIEKQQRSQVLVLADVGLEAPAAHQSPEDGTATAVQRRAAYK